MQIIAHGIDLVDFPRIEKMVEKHDDRFLERVFTEKEVSYAKKNKNYIEKLAGRLHGQILRLLMTASADLKL